MMEVSTEWKIPIDERQCYFTPGLEVDPGFMICTRKLGDKSRTAVYDARRLADHLMTNTMDPVFKLHFTNAQKHQILKLTITGHATFMELPLEINDYKSSSKKFLRPSNNFFNVSKCSFSGPDGKIDTKESFSNRFSGATREISTNYFSVYDEDDENDDEDEDDTSSLSPLGENESLDFEDGYDNFDNFAHIDGFSAHDAPSPFHLRDENVSLDYEGCYNNFNAPNVGFFSEPQYATKIISKRYIIEDLSKQESCSDVLDQKLQIRTNDLVKTHQTNETVDP